MVTMKVVVVKSKCGATFRSTKSTATSSLKVCTATVGAMKSNLSNQKAAELTLIQRSNSLYTASRCPRVRHVPHSCSNRESFSISKVQIICTQLKTILRLFFIKRRVVMKQPQMMESLAFSVSIISVQRATTLMQRALKLTYTWQNYSQISVTRMMMNV